MGKLLEINPDKAVLFLAKIPRRMAARIFRILLDEHQTPDAYLVEAITEALAARGVKPSSSKD